MISSLMDGRTGKQVRDRFLNKLRPNIRCGDWSQREDEILVSLCKEIGHRWSLIATHLPGRTEAQVKNRYYSSIKKRLGNDGTYTPSFDSKTNSENVTSFNSSPQQEDNGFDLACELDFASLNNCDATFVNHDMINNTMAKVSYVNESETYSERNTTQLPSPQNSSEYAYDPVNIVSYEDEGLFFTQMQRCGSFLLPVIENDHQVDYHQTHGDIDSFFAQSTQYAPVEEVKDVRLEQLNQRKAYLEMALANTLNEISQI